MYEIKFDLKNCENNFPLSQAVNFPLYKNIKFPSTKLNFHNDSSKINSRDNLRSFASALHFNCTHNVSGAEEIKLPINMPAIWPN